MSDSKTISDSKTVKSGKIHPGVAVGVVAAAIGAIFAVMYFFSEAPISNVKPGPNFGVEGGMSAGNPVPKAKPNDSGTKPNQAGTKPGETNAAAKKPPMAAQTGAKPAP